MICVNQGAGSNMYMYNTAEFFNGILFFREQIYCFENQGVAIFHFLLCLREYQSRENYNRIDTILQIRKISNLTWIS